MEDKAVARTAPAQGRIKHRSSLGAGLLLEQVQEELVGLAQVLVVRLELAGEAVVGLGLDQGLVRAREAFLLVAITYGHARHLERHAAQELREVGAVARVER